MNTRRCIVRLAIQAGVLLAGACLLDPAERAVSVAVDRATYTIDPRSSMVAIHVTLLSRGSEPAISKSCARVEGPAIHWALERLVGHEWKSLTEPFFACAPPTFADFTLDPKQRFSTSFDQVVAPGTYRLGVYFYDGQESWQSDWSRAWAAVAP